MTRWFLLVAVVGCGGAPPGPPDAGAAADAGGEGADAGSRDAGEPDDAGTRCRTDDDCPQDSPRTCSRCDTSAGAGVCDTWSPCAADCDAPIRPGGAKSEGCGPDQYRQSETAPDPQWLDPKLPRANQCFPVCDAEASASCALPECWTAACPGILGGTWGDCGGSLYYYASDSTAFRALEIVTAPWCHGGIVGLRHEGAPSKWIVRAWHSNERSPCDVWWSHDMSEWPFAFSGP